MYVHRNRKWFFRERLNLCAVKPKDMSPGVSPTPINQLLRYIKKKKERNPGLHEREKTKGKSELWICQKPAIHRAHKSQGNKEKWKDLVLKTHSSLNLCQRL